ncbi:reverse transcriptase domain-containing protein [Gemmata sp.]|uniref:reverse transcriptase domain-containing protein n=1 Tax=Gemmata sp. TaxID=1914242 RepID=UPI003F6FBDC8
MMSDFWNRRRRPAKTPEDHYRERRARRRRQLTVDSVFPVTVAMIADRDNLYHCYRELRREGGQAPGIDGLCYPDLSPGETGELLADLSRRVMTFSYRPQPARLVEIPKPGTTRTRTLSIPVLLDRVLARAAYEALSPFWEDIFLDCSWGFRHGRNAWGMLLAVEEVMELTGFSVLAIDDVKSAFEKTPLDPVLDCHLRLLDRIGTNAPPVTGRTQVTRRDEKKKVLWLVRTVLAGDDPSRTRGMPQGNNYSPTGLNGLFHDYLDVPAAGTLKHPLWNRYADNVCRLCRSVAEGEQALAAIRQHLAPLGMSLKGEDGVFDLKNGDEAQLLGFTLSLGEKKLTHGLGKRARGQLRRGLERAHETGHPDQTARRALEGWITSCGPAFETGEADVATILSDAAEYGFRELATPQEVRRLAQEARDAWIGFRKRGRVQSRPSG